MECRRTAARETQRSELEPEITRGDNTKYCRRWGVCFSKRCFARERRGGVQRAYEASKRPLKTHSRSRPLKTSESVEFRLLEKTVAKRPLSAQLKRLRPRSGTSAIRRVPTFNQSRRATLGGPAPRRRGSRASALARLTRSGCASKWLLRPSINAISPQPKRTACFALRR